MKSTVPRRAVAMLACLLSLAPIASPPAYAAAKAKAKAQAAHPAPKPAAPAAASPAPTGVATSMGVVTQPPTQRLSQALAQIGLTSCSAVIMQAATFLFEDGQANFTVQPLGPDANRWPTVIVIEGQHRFMGTTRLTTLTVSPGSTCSGFYQQIIWWPQPCDQLKKTVFADFKTSGVLLKQVQVSELGPGLQLYLQPAGTGCISTKKELFH